MSELRVDNIVDMGGSGAPKLRKGANVTGISTITQAVVGNATINAGGINATGIVTSSSNKFVGDLASGNITAGVMTATSSVVASNITINSGGVNASGIVSATSYQGSGANLTGIGLSIAPIIYEPTVGETGLGQKPTIELSVNQRIVAGSGNVNLRMVSVGSTIIESFGVGSSVTINNDGTLPKISFTPTNDLGLDSVICIDIPAGAFKTPTGTDIKATNWTFSVRSPYTLFVFGDNELAQLGQNSRTQRSSPTQIPGTWNDIIVSDGWMQGIRSNGTLWGWGRNNLGQLGQNSINSPANHHKSSPVQIPGTTWSSFPNNSSGGNQTTSAALKTDGTLWAWGSNTYGQFGINNRTQYSSPVQVPGTWDKTCIANNTSALIKDGELYTAGRNDFGQLGHNDRSQRSSPTQVPGTTWANVDMGDYGGATFGVKTDGTLWSMGYSSGNAYGILGHGDGVNYSSPTQIGTETTWSTEDNKISVGYRTVTAIKTDGTMWSWGGNQYGSIGNGQAYPGPQGYSSPVQVPGTTWSVVHRAAYSAYAMKTDGTAWAWGREDHGQLGQNSISGGANGYSSPIQIPGTNWAALGIHGGGNSAAGFKA